MAAFGSRVSPGSGNEHQETFIMNLSVTVHRLILAAGLCMALGAAQCVVVQPGGGGGGVITPPPPPPQTLYANANFTKAAKCGRRTGRNGGRGFYDIGLRRCYSCPRGYRRSVINSVRSRKACVRGISRFRRAENLGRSNCKASREFKFRRNCYRCPGGYRRVNTGGLRCYRRA